MDWHLIVAICGATFTCLASVGAVIYAGGKFVARVESAVKKIEGVEGKLEVVPTLVTNVETMKEMLRHHINSDHKELVRRVDDTRDIAVRAEMASSHDFNT